MHTVVDKLLLVDLVLVVEQRFERVGNLGYEALAVGLELTEVVSLLDQGIQGSNLEVWHGEGENGSVIAYDAFECIDGFVGRVDGVDGNRHQAVFHLGVGGVGNILAVIAMLCQAVRRDNRSAGGLVFLRKTQATK